MTVDHLGRPPAGPPGAPPLFLPDVPFPPYRFVPGVTPHPFAHREGWGHGTERPVPAFVPVERWTESDAYLRGLDFFNRGWWWEAHETWEELWHVVRGRDPAFFALLQGLIQLAACALQRERGVDAGAERLLIRALANLEAARGAAGAAAPATARDTPGAAGAPGTRRGDAPGTARGDAPGSGEGPPATVAGLDLDSVAARARESLGRPCAGPPDESGSAGDAARRVEGLYLVPRRATGGSCSSSGRDR